MSSHTPAAKYVRAVVTTRCPLSCDYCHMEGDPGAPGPFGALPAQTWIDLLCVAIDCGARKIKMVGGEPLVRRDLPDILRGARAHDPHVDLSIITSGAVPAERLERCFDAGLSRCNLTIHGFGEAEHARRGGTGAFLALRRACLETLFALGRPVKLNYVYTGPDCEADLSALLAWAAPRPCVIGVLDDLSNPHLGPAQILAALERLRGREESRWVEPDPNSLPTLRMRYADGLTVEVKSQRLGEVGAFASCAVCLRRPRCREGIAALRLTHRGELRPCMDRGDLGVPLVPALASGGRPAVSRLWLSWLAEVQP